MIERVLKHGSFLLYRGLAILLHSYFLFFLLTCVLFLGTSCSVLTTRPSQLMSDALSALRAAKEVQADTLSPELYRQANEWYLRGKQDYKFKNFYLAEKSLLKVKWFAEKAEYEALKNGGDRSIQMIVEDAPKAQASSYPYPAPESTPADVYDQRKAAEDLAATQSEKSGVTNTAPNPTPNISPSANSVIK